MATGDSGDMLRRLKSLIPNGWFNDVAPIRDVIFGGLSDALAWSFAQLQVVKAGTRRAGTTGWLLDLDAWGFFGSLFLRRSGENDASWGPRYRAEIFRPRVTRPAIIEALTDLTGRTPIIHEPWNTGDMGAIGVGTIAIAGQAYAPSSASGIGVVQSGGIGEGHLHIGQPLALTGNNFAGAGGIGSTKLPFQIFIDAYRPMSAGIPNIEGIGYGGIGEMAVETSADVESIISDAEIYATITRTVGAGITAWTALRN